MKALNVVLSVAVSLLIALLVLEGGLRLLGKGPPRTLNRFDARLGWSMKRDATVTRGNIEGFSVTFELNAHGLRDDADLTPEKPAGTFRVVALGDSFTLGFTVEREDLFVDQLERWWNAEGRGVQVVNTGTEAYSTDQEVAWLLEHGDEWQPDLVLLFPYENDVYWNGQGEYVGGVAKPLFRPDGSQETGDLENRFDRGWLAGTAIGRLLAGKTPPGKFEPGTKPILLEFGAILDERPDFMADPVARTRGALRALRDRCDELGARVVVVPIPSHSAVDPDFAASFEKRLGLEEVGWSADHPVDLFLALSSDAGLTTLDVRSHFRRLTEQGESLYFPVDWHIDPTGNRAFASFLHDELDRLGLLPEKARASELPEPLAQASPGLMARLPWLPWFLGLWALLGTCYAVTYRRDEKPQAAFAKVGGLLAVVFLIAVGGAHLLQYLPPAWAQGLLVLLLFALFGFVAWKLGSRLEIIAELMAAFVGRGHWYLMPLVTVLLTVGSLLVVAASSPLVAPFIYTLF